MLGPFLCQPNSIMLIDGIVICYMYVLSANTNAYQQCISYPQSLVVGRTRFKMSASVTTPTILPSLLTTANCTLALRIRARAS
ncbi:hypothetical protein VSVS12_03484 [Vibrio scophthalmi]|nr:hypothetical protein VSVS12_03484 [Vibrio scophthalmi]